MTENRNNYFRLVALIVDVAYLVISKYIKEKILGFDSFESFLNKEKHKLVHIYETFPCCKCSIQKINRKRLISREQLHILYKSDDGNQIRDHKKYARGTLTQICICKYSAKENIDVRVVDITLANYIIQKCGKHESGIDNWIEQIKDVRNEIFHLSDIREMTDQTFSGKWSKLEGSIMGIAKVIGSACAEEIEQIVMETKKITIVGEYMLQYEIICRDYWKNKCAEFESAQMQIIEEELAVHYTIPQLLSRSMGKDCQKTMKQIGNRMIDKINVMIKKFGNEENLDKFEAREALEEDMQRIRIPVCMQLDIPISWDKTKVFEALDDARLNGTPDKNIRIKAISIDDLNIFADISNKLLRNVDEFCSEINTMVSTMLSGAAIDTTEDAQLCVNVEIQDMPDNSNAVNISETKEYIEEIPDNFVNQQGSTTESDDNSKAMNTWNISETKEEIGELLDNSVIQQCSTTEPDDNSNAVNIAQTKEDVDELLDKSVNQQSSTTESDDNSNAVNISETKEKVDELLDEYVYQKSSTTKFDDSSKAVNISKSKKEISELLDNSVIQQCSTTEPDDNSNAVNISETKEEVDELPDESINQQSSTTESDGVSTAENIVEKEDEMGKPPDISNTQTCSTTEPKGVINAETRIETMAEIGKPTDISNNQDFSTTEHDEITSTTEEVIVQKSLKNNLPVSANLRQKLKISKKHFWNKDPDIYCCIKTGNTLVFNDLSNDQLFICNSDGTDKHHMSLSYRPHYITEIDSNTVAVSCDNNTIQIINISTRSITSTIDTRGNCPGISYNDNNLYVFICLSIIHVIDLTGKVIRTIHLPTDDIYDITVDRDRFVCIDDTSSIYCCSLDGKVMWKFKKDGLQDLRHVTTDNEGNVYVTDDRTHTVVVVSDDGKQHRELLTKSDGLDKPWGIYFDKKENILLVSNRYDGNAFLFDVRKKP